MNDTDDVENVEYEVEEVGDDDAQYH